MSTILKTFSIALTVAILFAACNKNKDEEIASGTTGSLLWKLTSNGTLTISGNGAIPNYAWNGAYYDTPWYSHCESIKTVVIAEGVTSIGYFTFSGCGLTSITIPNSITSIGDNAFERCINLTSVTIPDSVTSIGNFAFFGCNSLASISIPNSVTSIGGDAFCNCISLKSITIGNGLTSIGGCSGCSSLTSVTIGNSVTSIRGKAFENCSSLADVTIPNSVTSIGDGAFRNCSSLTSVTIPNNVTSIGQTVFYNCINLTEVSVLATKPPALFVLNSFTFPNTIPIYVPQASLTAYQAADGWSYYNLQGKVF